MRDDRHKDDRVSATYRKLATEHTPEQLDRRILAMAATEAGRPSYSRWISWSRPLAWAATITLCLAITLELVREPALQPTVAPVMENQTGPAADNLQQEDVANPDAATPADAGGEARQETFTLSAAEDRDENKAHGDGLAENRLDDPVTAPAKDQQAAKRADDANQSLARPEPQQEAAGSIAKISSADKEELARMRSSVQAGTAPPAEAARARRATETSERAFSGESDSADQACAEERRATAETWHECILELEAAGLDAAASHERDELKNSFPDFKRP